MRQPRPQLTASQAKRLAQLAAAIEAHRAGQPRRRLSPQLRSRVVAAIDAGTPVSVVCEACKVSGWQAAHWRQTAVPTVVDAPPSIAPTVESPRVLSVVDRDTDEGSLQDGEIELRIGGWCVSLRRVGP